MESSSEKNQFKLDPVGVKKGALIIRALNHKLRQSIIKLLEETERLSVTEIFVQLRIEQSVASQHLAILRTAGFLETHRDGKNIYYSINKKKLEDVYKKLLEITNI
jgi:ArsR family transcriptional regulator, virulence genes transcriptional regulator